jgi:hexokinase
MQSIERYEVVYTQGHSFTLDLAKDAQVLTADLDAAEKNIRYVHVLTDPNATKVTRHFLVAETGEPLVEGVGKYVPVWSYKPRLGKKQRHLLEIVTVEETGKSRKTTP